MILPLEVSVIPYIFLFVNGGTCGSQKMHFKCENPRTSSHQYVKSLTSTHYHIQVNIKTKYNYMNCIKTVYRCIKSYFPENHEQIFCHIHHFENFTKFRKT